MVSNQKNNLFDKKFRKRFIFILAVLLCVNFLLNAAQSFLLSPHNDSLELTDWKYMYDDEIYFPDLKDSRWQEANSENPIKIFKQKGDYLFLLGELSEQYSGEVLYIKSFYGQITVRVGSSTLITMSDKEKFSGNPTVKLRLPEFSGAQTIRITAYFPFSRNINIYASHSGVNHELLTYISYIPWGTSVLLILAGIIWCVLAMLLPKMRQLSLRRFIPAFILIFFGVLEFTDLYFLNVSSLFFKLRLAAYVLFSWLTLIFYVKSNTKWNSALEILTAVNVLYALCLGFLHYEVFYVITVKLGLILQIVNLCYMLHHMLFCGNSQAAFRSAFVAEIIIVQSIAWLSLLTYSVPCDFTLITTANVFYALYSMCAYIRKAPDTVKDKKEKITKEITDSAIYQREKGGLLIIPESSLPPMDIKLVNKEDTNDKELVFTSFEERFEMNSELLMLISEKCDTENNHMLHVAEFTNVLCQQMRLSPNLIYEITTAALLHDIGKLKVSTEVLFKAEKLTDDEFAVIRRHHLLGYELLKKSEEPLIRNYIAQIALEHHEHIDGTGYLKLKGNEIELGARIITVADVFDALVSPRVYKKTWSFEQGFEYIIKNSGSFFDEEVVNAFRESKSEFKRIYNIYIRQLDER